MVVDDSVVVRRIVTEVLTADPQIDLAGVAANGRIALAKIPQINPDIVTLDVEMPEMNGLETLVELRKLYPKLPVIMFSTLTERGGATTLEALARGASDYVTKPANVGSVNEAIQRLRAEMLPKIKGLCAHLIDAPRPPRMSEIAARVAARDVESRRRPALADGRAPAGTAGTPLAALRGAASRPPLRAGATMVPARSSILPGPLEVVVIGVSTGGPNALAALIPALPADFPVPVLVVQHMPPLFTKLLAERLTATSSLRAAEAFDGAVPGPGTLWIAPGDFHMTVLRNGGAAQGAVLKLNQDPPENSCRPAVDPLFRSAAQAFGPRALGVVLTGMGQDGLRGARSLVEVGARVLAQDEATSVVWGMPGYVASEGLADKVLPLGEIAGEIRKRVYESRPLLAARAAG
ncbi:MAG: chemotaxis-specific protein-glutamate methyltransferase CheB [Deltaproteobacteria bacterium]|nr:chemotaxis-specific protein-glutamate methyltransferase CheB [Deltaproteobacteria bacterium]